jgi:hypothetical protein
VLARGGDFDFPFKTRQTHHQETRDHGNKAEAVQEKARRHTDGANHQASDGRPDHACAVYDGAVE